MKNINFKEYLHLAKSALEDFKRNKVRTALTSLGILIGVMSVVLLIALGLGLKNYISDQFESMGANLIIVMPGSGFSGTSGGAGIVGGVSFDERDVNSLKRIDGTKYVVPMFMKSVGVDSGGEKKPAYIMGVNEEYFGLMNKDPVFGKYFSKGDVSAGTKVAVLGYKLAEELFGDAGSAVGKTIRFEGLRIKVIGVMEKTGDPQQDNGVTMPYRTTYGSLNPDKTFWSIYIGVESKDQVDAVKSEANNALLERYKEDDFSVTEQSEILSTINQIFSIINAVLVAIGSISLLVGGIGIMNIMYATVTERTKEIGIRRAVGATQRDIMVQFLTESLILSVFGGVAGLILASLIILAVRLFFPASINFFAVAITFLISSGIGIFFGVFPAKRASKLAPIEAIRFQ